MVDAELEMGVVLAGRIRRRPMPGARASTQLISLVGDGVVVVVVDVGVTVEESSLDEYGVQSSASSQALHVLHSPSSTARMSTFERSLVGFLVGFFGGAGRVVLCCVVLRMIPPFLIDFYYHYLFCFSGGNWYAMPWLWCCVIIVTHRTHRIL